MQKLAFELGPFRRGVWFPMPRRCELKLTGHSLLLRYQRERTLPKIVDAIIP